MTANPKSEIRNLRSHRGGVTLIELLVVILILTILTAAVIPTLTPNVEDRRLREAVRGINAFISGARSRAMSNGRPYGVWIERMKNEPGASMELHYVDMPPPVSGLYEDSRARYWKHVGGNVARFVFVYGSEPNSERFPLGFILPGDEIQFGLQGPRYPITLLPNDVSTQDINSRDEVHGFRVDVPSRLISQWVEEKTVLPYRIFRKPLRVYQATNNEARQYKRSAAAPYQLPDGVVIDLFASGPDDPAKFFQLNYYDPTDITDPTVIDTLPIIIMFAPNGSVKSVFLNRGTDDVPNIQTEIPLSGVRLLIGKRENMRPPIAFIDQTEENTNWLDLGNRWVTIGLRTGQVGTSEVAGPLSSAPPALTWEAILQSRRFAREMGSLGGK